MPPDRAIVVITVLALLVLMLVSTFICGQHLVKLLKFLLDAKTPVHGWTPEKTEQAEDDANM